MKWSNYILFIAVFGLSFFLLISIIMSATNIEKITGHIKATEDQTQKHIVIIAQELDNPFWRLLEQGAQAEAINYNAFIDYMGPQRINQTEQIQMLKKAIHYNPDGIIVQGIVNESYDQLIDEAYERGIPIITVDADSATSKRIAYVGSNQIEAGQKLAQYVLAKNEAKQHIGIIVGSLEADNQKERLEGFRSVIEQQNESEIIAVRSSNISRIKAADETVQLLKQFPQINTIVGLSSLDAAGIYDGLLYSNRLTENYAIYGFDQLAVTKELIQHNSIVASITQQPELMGANAIKTLFSHINGEDIDKIQYIPTTLLTYEEE